MPASHIVQVTPYQWKDLTDLYQLELAKGEPMPELCTTVTFQGRAFRVFGLLHYGDGHGPILLGVPVSTP